MKVKVREQLCSIQNRSRGHSSIHLSSLRIYLPDNGMFFPIGEQDAMSFRSVSPSPAVIHQIGVEKGKGQAIHKRFRGKKLLN